MAGASAVTQPAKGATTGVLETATAHSPPARGQLARPLADIGPPAAAQPAGALADTLATAGALTATDPLANPRALPTA